MKGFEPGLFEKLLDDSPGLYTPAAAELLTLEQVKESVARDLELLLNSRVVFPQERLQRFPHCQHSILSYGLNDFSGLSLASDHDRAYICQSLEQTIDRHEPRLHQVCAALTRGLYGTNRLHFAISALLVMHPVQEPVNFDALLQPTTLQYTVHRPRPRAN